MSSAQTGFSDKPGVFPDSGRPTPFPVQSDWARCPVQPNIQCAVQSEINPAVSREEKKKEPTGGISLHRLVGEECAEEGCRIK